jgi:FKBP-type peptidyl-prolyl cis-trans isomerase SlyD
MAQQSPSVSAGKVVGIYYTLKDDAGSVLDTNRKGGKPLAFLQGHGNILPALERALEGKSKNDFVSVTLEAADGYGEKKPEAVHKMPRGAFPPGVDLAPGMRFNGKDPEGRVHSVLVTEVGDDEVTVDENHPLAGVRLHFEVTIVGVRDSTGEEVEHGHPHGPDGHHH